VTIAPGVDPTVAPVGVVSGGQILIDKNLTIEGQGADATSIIGGPGRRIFKIGSVTPASVVTIRDLSLTDGSAPDGAAGTGAAGSDGGAIQTNATLTVNRVLLAANSAGDGGSGTPGSSGNPTGGAGGPGGAGGSGGAIFNQVGGNLTVLNSTFVGNLAGSGGDGGNGGNGGGMLPVAGAGGPGGVGRDGGAIQSTGVLSISNSTFTQNASGQGGDGGDKGAVGLGAGGVGGDGGDGGAIHKGGAGSVTISSSTIAGNTARGAGVGGMGSAGQAAPGADGAGGGTFFFNDPVTIANTLYFQNDAASSSTNCAGAAISTGVGSNLSFPAGGCPGSFSNGDPLLDVLGDYGGTMVTLRPKPGSAAIDKVVSGTPNCPGADQRGVARPQGALCDIGAVEVEQAAAGAGPGQAGQATGGTAKKKRKCKKRKRASSAKRKCRRKGKRR
jgi:hypothetical protein